MPPWIIRIDQVSAINRSMPEQLHIHLNPFYAFTKVALKMIIANHQVKHALADMLLNRLDMIEAIKSIRFAFFGGDIADEKF